MAVIEIGEVNDWLDGQKASVASLDDSWLAQITAEVFGAVQSKYSTEHWTEPGNTPILIHRIISMKYAGWYFHKKYSPDTDPGTYGELLLTDANSLLQGLVNGALSLPVPVVPLTGSAEIAAELINSEPVFRMDMVL